MGPLSLQTIEALTDVITGGSASDPTPSIGIYRSGPNLSRFFGQLNIAFTISGGSRVPEVRHLLQKINEEPNALPTVVRIIEAAVDPRDFIQFPDKLVAVVQFMNERLRFDGYELKLRGKYHRIAGAAGSTATTAQLREEAGKLSLESVQRDLERALEQADTDPPSAVTSACSTVESMCKCLLDEMKKPYPAKQDIQGLVREVTAQLNLSPARKDISKEIETDVKQVLSGLISVTGGIGALRTHGSDAHGRGKHGTPIDARIARLAIHGASTISLFLLETWQKRR
jgi:hypothetical protein